MEIEAADAAFLKAQIEFGDVILILGAGASAGSRNFKGDSVKMGGQLAELLAHRASLSYNGESLRDVLDAVRGDYLSDAQILSIYTDEFSRTTPSEHLKKLFNYTWKRVYTFNIDDTIQNINGRSSQIRRFYNGMVDSAAEFDTDRFLHVVNLHGDILKKEHGFIFTEEEYARALIGGKHHWYQRAGSDYIPSCPVFIGTSLSESIFKAEIERAKRDGKFVAGRGYVITPEQPSIIQLRSLRAKGLVHINATLEHFVAWLESQFPDGIRSADVLGKTSGYTDTVLATLSNDDIATAHFLKPIKAIDLLNRYRGLGQAEVTQKARQFLQGFGPDWLLASSEIPVKLDGFSGVEDSLKEALDSGDRVFSVLGPAGSGKTTATMMALVQFGLSNPNVPIYELSKDAFSATKAFKLLTRLHEGVVIVYVGDLFLYGDAFRESILSVDSGRILIVTSARQSEWSDHLGRYYSDICRVINFQKFGRNDFDPLIEKILQYVPAPRFRKMGRPDQYRELTRSKSQLLIALREATDSKNFNEIIADEYRSLPDVDTRKLLLIVGIATLARVGISIELAREAYENAAPKREFQRAIEALEGIIARSENGRFFARHDLYMRHIFDDLVSFKEMHEVIKSVLRTYVKYEMPIIKSVSRQDSHLFKFILNKDFISEVSANEGASGAEIYSDFEIDFQLDGHFWLQYGLYLASRNKLDEAIRMLENSIRAFSGNPFANHALANLQLRLAQQRPFFDVVTKDLIKTAVRTLNLMDAQPTLTIDEYPIVTLSNGHIAALLKHRRNDEAKIFAKEYFERLKLKGKSINSAAIESMQGKILRFVTLDEWSSDAPRRDSRRIRTDRH